MVAWYETSTKDSFKNDESIDGTQISTWYNIAPSGFLFKNNLTTTASDNITYEEDGINNIPSIYFSGGDDLSLANFAASPLTESTIVIVFEPTSDIGNTPQGIFDASSGNPGSLIGFQDNTLFLNAGIAANIATNFIGNASYIVMVNFNGSSSNAFINNTQVGGMFNSGTNALDGITIGNYENGGNSFNGKIAEVIIYEKSLSVSEREDVFSYLSGKYKIE
jgi:hypothetical protein